MDADEIIERLGLLPHPEGGHFLRVYESRDQSQHPGGSSGRRPKPEPVERQRLTHIYFLLKRAEISRWHRVDADELWHHYAGAPLELTTFSRGSGRLARRLGKDLAAGESPLLVVPADTWQTARTLGDYTLVGASVSPGFTFEGFELAPGDFDPSA